MIDRICRYYNECQPDYRLIWRVDKNLGIHYGYGDGDHNKAVVRMNEVMATRAMIKDTDVVLDAGCGLGGTSIWLALNRGCRVVGIDINDKLIARARERACKLGIDRVDFIQGDYTQTGFPDEYFDVVIALESMCYAPDKYNFLVEVRRVLKTGGRFVVADGFLYSGTNWDIKRWRDGWEIPNLIWIGDFEKYLNILGFTDVYVTDITRHIMPSSRRMYRFSLFLYPLAKFLEYLRLRTSVQTGNVVSGILQHRVLEEGLARYYIISAVKGKHGQ